MDHPKCLVVGCGYLGARVADAWKQRGFQVFATTRTESRAEELAGNGLQPIVLNVADPIPAGVLPPVERVLFAVGFDRSSSDSQHAVYVDGLRHILDGLANTPKQLIYISSTGVYGQSDGRWVDEESETQPTRPGGQLCLAAEELLRRHPRGANSVTLRLAGIYGPERVPFLAKLRAGEPLPVATDGYLNLIHVNDAVQVVLACPIETGSPQLFVVSDGTPVIRRTYYDTVAGLLGLSVEYEPPDPECPRTHRAMGSKRVSNQRVRQQLGIKLQYPTYEHGLAAILADDTVSD